MMLYDYHMTSAVGEFDVNVSVVLRLEDPIPESIITFHVSLIMSHVCMTETITKH